jgi:hypothetical protein
MVGCRPFGDWKGQSASIFAGQLGVPDRGFGKAISAWFRARISASVTVVIEPDSGDYFWDAR